MTRFPGWRAMSGVERRDAKMHAMFEQSYELKARAAGWFPATEAHVMFRQGSGVCRHLKDGETYNPDTDSYMSTPLRHADSWREACSVDNLA